MWGVALRRKTQLEEWMQGQHTYPPDQVIQMKEVDEEHRVVPVDKQGDAFAQGRRLGGSAAIVWKLTKGGVVRTAALTMTTWE